MTPKADFFTGIGIVIFAAVMFSIAGKMPAPASYGLGPGGYPMLVTGVLILLGAILSIQGWLGMRRHSGASADAASEDAASTDAAQPEKKTVTLAEFKGIALLALSFWAYVFLMKYLGYLITTVVFMFLFLLQYGGKKWPQMILISVIATGVTWALFVYAFRIFLPEFYFL